MAYLVNFHPETEKDVKKLEQGIAQRILNKIKWLSLNFELITPQPLGYKFKDKFKLRVGDYRVIYEVNQKKKLITVNYIGHRKDIYK